MQQCGVLSDVASRTLGTDEFGLIGAAALILQFEDGVFGRAHSGGGGVSLQAVNLPYACK